MRLCFISRYYKNLFKAIQICRCYQKLHIVGIFKQFSNFFVRDYICINFGVYDAFLSEVMLGSAILHSSESLLLIWAVSLKEPTRTSTATAHMFRWTLWSNHAFLVSSFKENTMIKTKNRNVQSSLLITVC